MLTKGSGYKMLIIFYTTMISGDMLQARVYLILKFSLFACYLQNIMSFTDREHLLDYNQVSECHTRVIIVIILITLHFW